MTKSKLARLLSSTALLVHLGAAPVAAQGKACKVVSPATDVVIAKLISDSKSSNWQSMAYGECDVPFREAFIETGGGSFREALGPDDPFMDPSTQVANAMSSCAAIELPINMVAGKALGEDGGLGKTLQEILPGAQLAKSTEGYDRCRSGMSVQVSEPKTLLMLYEAAVKGGRAGGVDFGDTVDFKP